MADSVVVPADFHDCIQEVVDCNWAVVDRNWAVVHWEIPSVAVRLAVLQVMVAVVVTSGVVQQDFALTERAMKKPCEATLPYARRNRMVRTLKGRILAIPE